MTPQDHRELRVLLGAYVLGHLEAPDARTVRSHLAGCAPCAEEAGSLAPVAARLAAADLESWRPAAAVPADLGARVLERVGAARAAERSTGRGLHTRAVRVLAAAAVIAAGLGFLGGVTVADSGDGAGPPVPFEPVTVELANAALVATAGLVPHTWGVEIKLVGSGFAVGETYAVTVRDRAGREVSAGEFIGTGEAPMTCNLNSSVLRADAASFEVADSAGAVVVSARL